MDFELPQFSDEVWNGLLKGAFTVGLERGVIMILVASRLAGAVFIGPMLGRSFLTWPVRIGLVIVLTAIVTPQLPINGIANEQIEFAAYSNPGNTFPLATFVLAVLRDAAIGAALGLGVAVFLSGVHLAGEWFDRHSGLGMGSILNPEFSTGGSGPAEIVSLFCIVSFLVLQPMNGHLLIVRLILDSFHALPVGGGQFPQTIVELPGNIVQQSLVLGLRIAMPFVVAMSLLDLTFGYAHRSSRWQLAPSAYVVRAGVSLLILAATFPGIQEAATLTLQDALQIANEAVVTAEVTCL